MTEPLSKSTGASRRRGRTCCCGSESKRPQELGCIPCHDFRFKTSEERGRRLDTLRAFQPQHDQQEVAAWLRYHTVLAANQWLGCERQRQVERLTNFQAEELSRGDPNDRESQPLHDQRLADGMCVARQPTLPER